MFDSAPGIRWIQNSFNIQIIYTSCAQLVLSTKVSSGVRSISTVPGFASQEKHRAPIGRGEGHEPKVTKSARETARRFSRKGGQAKRADESIRE